MFRKKSTKNDPDTKKFRGKVLIFVLAVLLCGYFAYLTNHLAHYGLPGYTTQAFYHKCEHYHTCVRGTVELQPGKTLEQHFRAAGKVVGSCWELYLEVVPPEEGAEGTLSVELLAEDTGEVLASSELEIAQIPEDGIAAFPFAQEVITKSGRDYCVTVTNDSQTGLEFCVNSSVQSGSLLLDGQKIDTFLNFGVLRTSLYSPSKLFTLMLALTCVTVLAGLALVLFRNVKEHVLYLVLAVGFGLVALFDLTPLYGFDMKFQFDSAYVLSNELLGMEGAVYSPSAADPSVNNVHYYRRACDDYSAFQFFYTDSVSDNYVDTYASLRNLRVDEGDDELILVESAQGFVSDQLYILYLPQAVGFALARLLGLSFIPMVQLGRMAAYGVFVLLMFLAIRSVPFGKRLFLILGLLPAVMTQTVSITRDTTIFSLSFFLAAKVLQAAYAEHKPTVWNWIIIVGVSALLAPCKAVYLPMAFLWLLVIYRQYVYGQKADWKKVALRTLCCTMPIVISLVLFSSVSIPSMLGQLFSSLIPKASAAEETVSAAAGLTETAAVSATYTFSYICSHLPEALMVFANTFRQELGMYLVNAIQLFEIDLGSSDAMTVLILFLLVIESCRIGGERERIQPGERYFGLLVAAGVLLLTALASMQWTSVGTYTLYGLQGRYLTPALPLICFALMNNRVVRISGKSEVFVKACCCVFPAVYLMNMYLWTIMR